MPCDSHFGGKDGLVVVLINGALAIGVTRPDSHPALAARQLAEQLLSGTD